MNLPGSVTSYTTGVGVTAPPQLLSAASLGGNANVMYAQLCAFQNALSAYAAGNYVSNCVLASPINPSQIASAIVDTYSPSYNSTGACGPPPQSLLQQTNFNCNIYGVGGLPATCSQLNGGLTGTTAQQYCFVQSFDGNGICTSQLGLFNAVTTNAIGYFSTNVVACGLATSTIEAQYYGSPGPEPILSTQPVLTQSANVVNDNPLGAAAQQAGSILSSTSNGFAVYNYVWTPNATGEVVNVGLFELGYGDLGVAEVLCAVVGAVVLMALKVRHDRSAQLRSGRRNSPKRRSSSRARKR